MKERIKELIEYENISYSKFAEIVGIQRSGVSHIINGRNNPSLEVIQKILESFDYISTDWLLMGKGNMKRFTNQGELFEEETDNEKNTSDEIVNDFVKSKSEEYIDNNQDPIKIIDSQRDKNIQEIERIVIFFIDNTFKEYKS